MARVTCKCGNYLCNSGIPDDTQLLVYTEGEWDRITVDENLLVIDLPDPQYEIWRCQSCERIYVFEEGSDTPIKTYALEKD